MPIKLGSTRKYGDVFVRFGGETFGRPSLMHHTWYAFIIALERLLYLCWKEEAASS
jgi:hypothetical protein